MLVARPLSDTFSLPWSGDSAIDSSVEDFDDKFRQCRETLNFSPLIKPGETPTMFVFKAIRGPEMEALRATSKNGEFSPTEAILAFRMALIRVDNADGFPKLVKVSDGANRELGLMVADSFMRFLDAQATEHWGNAFNGVASELGTGVFLRSISPSPK
jgi:hypothetical protein